MKKKCTRFLALLLIVATVFSALSMSAFAGGGFLPDYSFYAKDVAYLSTMPTKLTLYSFQQDYYLGGYTSRISSMTASGDCSPELYSSITQDYSTGKKAYFYHLRLWCNKYGISTIKTCSGGKTTTTKVVTKKYVNPVKYASISGLNNGKNLASLTVSDRDVSFPDAKHLSAAKMKITAISGWKIRDVILVKSFGAVEYGSSAGKQTVTMTVNTQSITCVRVVFQNSSNKGLLEVYYTLY